MDDLWGSDMDEDGEVVSEQRVQTRSGSIPAATGSDHAPKRVSRHIHDESELPGLEEPESEAMAIPAAVETKVHASVYGLNDADTASTVFVGGIHSNVTKELLWELFLFAGPVVRIHIGRQQAASVGAGATRLEACTLGRGRVNAFVEFFNRAAAESAVWMFQGVSLFGQPLNVKPAGQERAALDTTWTLHVTGVPAGMDEAALFDLFLPCGPPSSLLLVRGRPVAPPRPQSLDAPVPISFAPPLSASTVSGSASLQQPTSMAFIDYPSALGACRAMSAVHTAVVFGHHIRANRLSHRCRASAMRAAGYANEHQLMEDVCGKDEQRGLYGRWRWEGITLAHKHTHRLKLATMLPELHAPVAPPAAMPAWSAPACTASPDRSSSAQLGSFAAAAGVSGPPAIPASARRSADPAPAAAPFPDTDGNGRGTGPAYRVTASGPSDANDGVAGATYGWETRTETISAASAQAEWAAEQRGAEAPSSAPLTRSGAVPAEAGPERLVRANPSTVGPAFRHDWLPTLHAESSSAIQARRPPILQGAPAPCGAHAASSAVSSPRASLAANRRLEAEIPDSTAPSGWGTAPAPRNGYAGPPHGVTEGYRGGGPVHSHLYPSSYGYEHYQHRHVHAPAPVYHHQGYYGSYSGFQQAPQHPYYSRDSRDRAGWHGGQSAWHEQPQDGRPPQRELQPGSSSSSAPAQQSNWQS